MGPCVRLHTTSDDIKTFTLYKANRSAGDQIQSRFVVGSSVR